MGKIFNTIATASILGIMGVWVYNFKIAYDNGAFKDFFPVANTPIVQSRPVVEQKPIIKEEALNTAKIVMEAASSIEDIVLAEYPFDYNKEYQGVFPVAAYKEGIFFGIRDGDSRVILRKKFISDRIDRVAVIPNNEPFDKSVEGKIGEFVKHELMSSDDGRYLLFQTPLSTEALESSPILDFTIDYVKHSYFIDVKDGKIYNVFGKKHPFDLQARFLPGTHTILYGAEIRDFDMDSMGKHSIGLIDCDKKSNGEYISVPWEGGTKFCNPNLINLFGTHYLLFRTPCTTGSGYEDYALGITGTNNNSKIGLMLGGEHTRGEMMQMVGTTIATDTAVLKFYARQTQTGIADVNLTILSKIPKEQRCMGFCPDGSKVLYAEVVEYTPTEESGMKDRKMYMELEDGKLAGDIGNLHSLTGYDTKGNIVMAKFINPKQRIDFAQWTDNERIIYFKSEDKELVLVNLFNFREQDKVLLDNVDYYE